MRINPGYEPEATSRLTRDAKPCLGRSTFGYDVALGVRISRDPIGETGGVNLYQYVDNNPTNGTDPLGLLTITYSLSQNTMFVADLYAMDFRVLAPFHSGKGAYRDNPAFQDMHNKGPIPLGDYTIFYRGFYKETGYLGYMLDAIDAVPGDDIYQPNGRDEFRLHFGASSIGCPTTTSRDAMQQLIDMIQRSGPIRAWGPSGLIPHPQYGHGQRSYGIMHVVP